MIQPEPFNRFRFRRYARELSKAVAEMGDYGARFTPTPHMRVIPQRQIMSEPTPMPAVEIVPVKPEPIKKNLTGASFLANLIRTQHAAIKKQLDDAGSELVTAMTDLQETANEATNQVKAVKAETADLKAALGLNSNGEQG